MTGLEDIPADERPPANTLLHLSFDAMVGIGTRAAAARRSGSAFVWWRRRDIPQTPWFLRAVAVSGAGAIVALWCGWIVTEVGRQPWIVQGYMRTEEAVTEAEGIWFSLRRSCCVLYAALGHDRDPGPARDVAPLARRRGEPEAPDGRRGRALRPRPNRGREVGRGGGAVSKADVAAAILWVGATLYALFGGADFGGGFWDLIAGDAEKGERPRALIQRSLTPVWEANHVWLIFILVVLWTAFPPAFSAIMTTLYVPIALAALGIVLRGAGFAFRKSIEGLAGRRAAGRDLRPLLGADPVLHGHGGRRDRLRQRAGGGQRRRLLELAAAAAAADRGDVRRHRRLPRGGLPGRRRAPRGRRRTWSATSRAGPWRPRPSPASPLRPAWSSCTPKPATSSTASIDQGAAAGDPLGALRARPCSRPRCVPRRPARVGPAPAAPLAAPWSR